MSETALLLVVGLTVGHLAARGHGARHFARSEIRRIHRVADTLARGDAAELVVKTAERELRDLLTLRDCWFESAPYLAGFPRIERTGTIDVRVHRFAFSGLVLPAGGVELPVWGQGSQVGRFVVVPAARVGVSVEQRLLAVTIADQVGAALAAASTPPSGSSGPPPAG